MNDFGYVHVLLISLPIFVSMLLRPGRIERQIARVVSRIDVKLDLLLKSSGVAYDPYKDLPQEFTRAIQRGDKIGAMKCYREATGVGLREAKKRVEDIQRQTGNVG